MSFSFTVNSPIKKSKCSLLLARIKTENQERFEQSTTETHPYKIKKLAFSQLLFSLSIKLLFYNSHLVNNMFGSR